MGRLCNREPPVKRQSKRCSSKGYSKVADAAQLVKCSKCGKYSRKLLGFGVCDHCGSDKTALVQKRLTKFCVWEDT